jgi:peroxiredoxin
MSRLIVIVAALLFGAPGHAFAANTVPLRALDDPRALPRITLADSHGEPHAIQTRAGAVTVLHFWATWCLPCVKELPALQALPSRVGDCELDVVTVAADRRDEVRNFAASHALDLRILIDQYGEAMHALRVRAFPETQVADSRGRIRLAATGVVDWRDATTQAQLKGLCG